MWSDHAIAHMWQACAILRYDVPMVLGIGCSALPYHGTHSLKSCRRAPALLHAERRAGERLLPCIEA